MPVGSIRCCHQQNCRKNCKPELKYINVTYQLGISMKKDYDFSEELCIFSPCAHDDPMVHMQTPINALKCAHGVV